MKLVTVRAYKRYLSAAVMLVFFCAGLAGCAKGQKDTVKEREEIRIPVCFLVDPQTGEGANRELVDAFNEEYKGIYVLDVEWITETAEGYRARMKTLNALDKLPAVITDVGFDDNFYRLLLANNRLADLMPYMEKEEEWLSGMEPNMLDACMEPDGSMYMATIGSALFSYAGFYYNKELFEKAGIKQFPRTWDDFFQCLDRLKEKHITPLALHGGSSCWTALLIGTNYMAQSPEGGAFLQNQYPQSYYNNSVREMFQVIKKLYSYGEDDALDIEHNTSALRFQEGKSAIMANGGWMIMDLPKELREKLGFAPFPGNQLMNEPKMTAWAVTEGHGEDVTAGAAEFLKFRFLRDKKSTEEFINKKSTLLEEEYKSAVQRAEKITPNYQLKWEESIQNNILITQLPLYIQDQITLGELIKAMDEEVLSIRREQ